MVMRGGGGVSVEVMVVVLCGGSWGCRGEVWLGDLGFLGLGFGEGMVCGRELY